MLSVLKLLSPRSWLTGLALLCLLAVIICIQQLRIDSADSRAALSDQHAKMAVAIANDAQALAGKLRQQLIDERTAQASLQSTQRQLRTGLAERQLQIETLKRENQELRAWADQPLPDVARRLRERPAITGATAYRDWLSGRSAVPPATDQPEQQRPTAQ